MLIACCLQLPPEGAQALEDAAREATRAALDANELSTLFVAISAANAAMAQGLWRGSGVKGDGGAGGGGGGGGGEEEDEDGEDDDGVEGALGSMVLDEDEPSL